MLLLTALACAATGADAGGARAKPVASRTSDGVKGDPVTHLTKQLRGLLAGQERLRRDNGELVRSVEKVLALLARDDAQARRERMAAMELLRGQLNRQVARELRARDRAGSGSKTDATDVKASGATARKQADRRVAQLRTILAALERLTALDTLISELRRIDQEQPEVEALLLRLRKKRVEELLAPDRSP
jgi:hypothetical protein